MEFDDCVSSAMIQSFRMQVRHTLPIRRRQWLDIDRMRQRRIHMQRDSNLPAHMISLLSHQVH